MFKIIKNTDGKINFIIVAVIILVNFLLMGGFYFFFMMEPAPEQPAFHPLESSEPPTPRNNARTEEARKLAKEESEEESTKDDGYVSGFEARDFITDYTTWPLGQIAVNPSGSQRFFIATITFEYRLTEIKLPTELKNKLPLFNDALMSYFSKKTEDELRNIDNRDGFKDDIRKMINAMLIEGKITNVLFEQFVLQ